MLVNTETIIFDFGHDANVNKWYQTNDNVMGGVSNSEMTIDENGNGVFSGNVSLENYGGFAMTRLPLNLKINQNQKKVILYLKGDGKVYQFRLKSDASQSYWFVHSFQTTTENQIVEIPLNEFYPSYRGRKLNMENFSSDTLKEVAILIGNKKNESFELLIDKITLH